MIGWWFEPLWMMKFPIYGKMKNVPNHQPDNVNGHENSACQDCRTELYQRRAFFFSQNQSLVSDFECTFEVTSK
jgi:hypothetical protein